MEQKQLKHIYGLDLWWKRSQEPAQKITADGGNQVGISNPVGTLFLSLHYSFFFLQTQNRCWAQIIISIQCNFIDFY